MIFNKEGLTAQPIKLCVDQGDKVTINIKPPGESAPGTVIALAKNPKAGIWLVGSNSDPLNPDKITIEIPEWVNDGEYPYLFLDTATGACLDPRWEVK